MCVSVGLYKEKKKKRAPAVRVKKCWGRWGDKKELSHITDKTTRI
jgi:hypothetical protein